MNTGLKIIKQFPKWTDDKFRVNNWNSQFIDSNVIINSLSSDVYFPIHWTPLSIKCAFGGAEYYVTDNLKYRVDDRSFLVLNEGRMYESFINSDTPVESFTVCFSPQFVKRALLSRNNNPGKALEISVNSGGEGTQELRFFETLYKHNNVLSALLQKLRMAVKNGNYNKIACEELLHHILDKLISFNSEFLAGSEHVEKTKPSTRTELFRRLNIAKDYIDSCFNSKIELHEISKASGLSEHYMIREFKKFFSITPYQYLTARRLDEAKRLLMHSRIPISQISLLVGFEYLSSFTKLFKRRFKLSPNKFRNNNI